MLRGYEPLVEITRGPIVESIQFGAVAVVDSSGKLLASLGDPGLVTFLRSSAKPFQALPFIERNGDTAFGFSPREVSLICASHSGTDEHVRVVSGIQQKIGAHESDLMCGTHIPEDAPTALALALRAEKPTPNRHNCSGKHTGMLAHARLRGLPLQNYLDLDHPVQTSILQAFAEMCAMEPGQVVVGIDGCSAPNFAVPLQNAALGYARLADPQGCSVERAAACGRIVQAMTSHPDMIAGPDRFDTLLMEAVARRGSGRIVVKTGAEGYQAIGLQPGVLGAGSPGVGIAFKVSDGDAGGRVRPVVVLEILRRFGAISTAEMEELSRFACRPIYNQRSLRVGEIRPAFDLH
jgi:L-asparaginase II